MSAFIHGEVNWTERPWTVGANVQRMLDVVDHYPWASASIDEVSSHPVSYVTGISAAFERLDQRFDLPGGRRDAHVGPTWNSMGAMDLSLSLRCHRRALAMSDETLVLLAYRRWGLRFAERILGEGAFALWDASEQRLMCWRDAAGVRPLYYHHAPGEFLFSSDLQSIAAHPATPSMLDLSYTNAFLARRAVPAPHADSHPRRVRSSAAHMFDLGSRWSAPSALLGSGRIGERTNAHDGDCVEELLALLRLSIS